MKSNSKPFEKRAGRTKPAQLMVAGTLFFLLSYAFLGPNPLSYNVCIKLMTFCKQTYNYGDAAKIGEYFLSTTKVLPGLRDLEKAEIEFLLGEVYLEQEKFTAARALFMEVLSIANKQALINKRLKVKALVNLAKIAARTQHYEESKGYLDEALAILEKVPEQKLTFAQTKVYLATIYARQGNLVEADKLLEDSLAMTSSSRECKTCDSIRIKIDIALVYWNSYQLEKAESILKTVVVEAERSMDCKNLLGEGLSHLGAVYTHQKRYSEAESLLNRALTMNIKLFGAGHDTVGSSYFKLGECYRMENKFEESKAAYHNAFPIIEKRCGKNSEMVARVFLGLAEIAQKERDYQNAAILLRNSISILESKSDRNKEELIEELMAYEKILQELKRPQEAIAISKRIEQLRQK